jgi:hypothetical protein
MGAEKRVLTHVLCADYTLYHSLCDDDDAQEIEDGSWLEEEGRASLGELEVAA